MLRLEAIESARIQGEKTFIRPMGPDEIQTFYSWATDPEVAPFWGGKDHYQSLDQLFDDWKPFFFDGSQPGKGRCFTIEADGKPVGMVAAATINTKHRSVDVDILIGEADYRDRGYGTDALSAFVRFLIKEVGMHRVTIGTYSYNHRSIRSNEKAGFVREGVMREADIVDGQFVDVVFMSILERDIGK